MQRKNLDGGMSLYGEGWDQSTQSLAHAMPSPADFEATDHYARAISLHCARMHAAVEMAKDKLLADARGDSLVTRQSHLAAAIGHDLDVQRVVNALEAIDIPTVGELLDVIQSDASRLLEASNVQMLSVTHLLAAVLRNAI